jgi:beta-glucosidase
MCLIEEILKKGEVVEEKENLPEWYRTLDGIPSQKDFETLLGRKIIEKTLKKGEFTKENTVMEMKEDSSVMKILYKVLERMMAKGNGGKVDYNNPEFRMMMATSADCSMRGMKINGQMNNHLLEGLLEMANGHFGKGLREILKK